MATTDLRVTIDTAEVASMVAELNSHVDRLGAEEAFRRIGRKIDISKMVTLEWRNKSAVRAIPTAAFHEMLRRLAAD